MRNRPPRTSAANPITTDDALALIRQELRRLAFLLSELADRIEVLERRLTMEEPHDEEG